MGRGKLEIKRIESTNARHVTFSKRRQGLFKKASELAILCDAEVAVIIFSGCGRVYEFSSSDMSQILARFNERLESQRGSVVVHNAEEPNRACDLHQEIEKLRLKQRQLLGKDLTGMGLQELHALDKQLQEGLMSVTNRKEQILIQQIQESKTREKLVIKENEILERQVGEIQRLITPINYITPHSTQHIPETTDNVGAADSNDPDTILLLGPPCSETETDDGMNSETKTDDGMNSETKTDDGNHSNDNQTMV